VENILYDKKTKHITYVDLECSVLGDELYDLALIPRMYVQFISPQQYLSLMKQLNLKKSEQLRLIPLMICGCLIKIATSDKTLISYTNAIQALKTIQLYIIPAITLKK
jgi:hypothetical protein